MGKLPFFQFYPSDWIRDTRSLSAPVKGIWIDILAIAWNEPKRGIYARYKDMMSRELGIALEDLEDYLAELDTVADISETEGIVTVLSRRMVREERERELNRKRVAKFRGNDSVTQKYESSNASVMVEKSEVRSQKLEVRIKDTSNTRLPDRFSKPTSEEVTAYAKTIAFDLDGRRFCDYYEANGWRVGKNPMKDWQAAVRTWKRNDQTNGGLHASNGGAGISFFADLSERERKNASLRAVDSRQVGTVLERLRDHKGDETHPPKSDG